MSLANAPTASLTERIASYTSLLQRLQKIHHNDKRLQCLETEPEVLSFLQSHPAIATALKSLAADKAFLLLSTIAIGQGSLLFYQIKELHPHDPALNELIQALANIEKNYAPIGGIIGYHLTFLKLIVENSASKEAKEESEVHYLHPPCCDITEDNTDVRQSIRIGITSLPQLAEIYPVGGAGDRLNLIDETTNTPLPVAFLNYLGRPLLEGLIRDLQGREYLYFKLFGKQQITPIALMTSHEKDNDALIKQLCEEQHWFGRPKSHFHFITQPLVPVITIKGEWAIHAPLKPMLKPGGHGVIWKIAQDNGVLNSLTKQGSTHALVRQINNPIASTDYGLFALIGLGIKLQKTFGFSSCPRKLGASEGMDVLMERPSKKGVDYTLTNIEYTVFERHRIKDTPSSPNSPYSQFPANTNILFVDLAALRPLIEKCPLPGLMINLKTRVCTLNADGFEEDLPAGRLETTMQNIADLIVNHYPAPLTTITPDKFDAFVAFNKRQKTISVCKKPYIQGGALQETPQGCFYTMMKNYEELLTKYCHFHLPHFGSEKEFALNGPAFIFLFHPALGPLYQVIAQKIRKGSFAFGAELQLEIAEVDIEELHLEGSLLVKADAPLGTTGKDNLVRYNTDNGKCTLRGCTVRNQGIDRAHPDNLCWKNQLIRLESLEIVLHGNAEFVAEGVTFSGPHHFEVPEGHRMVVSANGDKRLEKIDRPSWCWKYAFDEEDRIRVIRGV